MLYSVSTRIIAIGRSLLIVCQLCRNIWLIPCLVGWLVAIRGKMMGWHGAEGPARRTVPPIHTLPYYEGTFWGWFFFSSGGQKDQSGGPCQPSYITKSNFLGVMIFLFGGFHCNRCVQLVLLKFIGVQPCKPFQLIFRKCITFGGKTIKRYNTRGNTPVKVHWSTTL